MRSSVLIAASLALLLAGWLASPYLAPMLGFEDQALVASEEEAEAEAAARAEEPAPTPVRVADFFAEPTLREVTLAGKTAPERVVSVAAEVDGRVVELPVRKGSSVEAGEIIAVLDREDREAIVAEARATVEQRRIEADAASQLSQKGFQTETALAESKALLAQARALLQRAELDLASTAVRSPIEGVLDRQPVEVGSFLQRGDVVGQVVQLDPLEVVVDVPEADVMKIEPGQRARVSLPDGSTIEGLVRFVSKEAESATRTFVAEIEVPNPDGRVPAGVSARAMIEIDETPAHEVPLALLELDDEGRLGVKRVDERDVVVFERVEVVKAGPSSAFVRGLPEEARLITVGGGFVAPGQKVRPVEGDEPLQPGEDPMRVAEKETPA